MSKRYKTTQLTLGPPKRRRTDHGDLHAVYQAGPSHHETVDGKRNVGKDGIPATVDIVLRDMTSRLVSLINGRKAGDFIYAAMAWLTSEPILTALGQARKRGVEIAAVVQKEDFLRPDKTGVNRAAFTQRLRRQYDALGTLVFDDPDVPVLSRVLILWNDWSLPIEFDGQEWVSAVRCVGNYNADRDPAFPRMHNKFFIFGHCTSTRALDAYGDEYDRITPIPDTVWTGSFNASANAELSFENAVVIHAEDAGNVLLSEWATLFAMSEPLDWDTEWIAPKFWHGT